jgi:rare lipoprotein A
VKGPLHAINVGIRVIVWASMVSFVCVDLGYGGSKNNNRDFKSVSGVASVYDRSSGKQTASGEQLDEHALTAAHRSFPFGTVVRVKNKRNGREALVRINDRGPFVRGRIIDLTPAAAKVLGFSGTADVSLAVANASTN